MKALFFSEHGGMDVLQYGEVPTPEPGPGEVLVKVSACALNHLDVWVRRGWPGLKLPMPHWCGADVAGEVAGLGPGVTGWKTGHRVVIDPGISTRRDEYTRRGADSLSPGYRILGEHIRGGAAEYVCVPADNLAEIPRGIDDTEAAAPLLVTLTAWRMLIRQARLRAGESVLVVGAGGGVNSMAIQVAKLAGAKVFVVAGDGQKARRAVGLGADEVIDRSRLPAWDRELHQRTGKRGVDVVVDNVGRATLQTSLRAAARGGRIVVVGNTSGPEVQLDLRYVFGKQLSIIGSTMGSHQDFRDVLALLWVGRLKPVIHRVMPLSEGAAAYGIMERGEHFGKIVLIPRH